MNFEPVPNERHDSASSGEPGSRDSSGHVTFKNTNNYTDSDKACLLPGNGTPTDGTFLEGSADAHLGPGSDGAVVRRAPLQTGANIPMITELGVY